MAGSEKPPTLGYVVSTWPRLSQTFVLREILAVERLGVPVRIFSTKDPDGEPVHGDVAHVRAGVTYLTLRRHWKPALWANLRLVRDMPAPYARTLLSALRYRRWDVMRRFFQAGYLADLLRRDPVDHLHAHFATAPALVAMLTHQLSAVPYTFTAHARDIYVDTQPELLRAEMERAAAVVTVSEYNRGYLSRQLGPTANGKVRCIYNGLDLHQFPFDRTRPADAGPPIILAVGRLIEKKGLGDLIAAADILRRRGRSFRVEIIGAGPLAPALEAQVQRLALQDQVAFLGAQPQEAVRLAYRRATIFALPCVVTAEGDRDGIPTVLLEAMASGVPVVSTSISGIPEVIQSGHNGLLVAPHDPAMLAGALDLLLADADLGDRLAYAARRTIEATFSIERNSAQLVTLFERGGGDGE
jgi:glycosyltransferase involved in cell wall biosynthesis